MKEFFLKHYEDKKYKIGELFVDHKISNESPYFDNFKKLYQKINNEEYNENSIELSMPIMYYNNFNIINVNIWNEPKIQEIINKIDEQGYIFYCRWGDAPLQTIILSLYDSNRITKVNFKYSKRLQRESFKDDEGTFHSYMPGSYDNSSCISKNT
jgi:hypothetical protein